MTDWTDEILARSFEAAKARGREEAQAPRATSARYVHSRGRIVVELNNGCTFAFPARKVQGLDNAPATALADIELLGGGYGLHWPRPNVSLTVEGALVGIFGNRKWMEHLAASDGKKGRRSRKPDHAAA